MRKRAIKVERCKRSASSSIVGCAPKSAEPHVERVRSVIYTEHRRQTMNEPTAFVGLDVHAESTAIGLAETGRAAATSASAARRVAPRVPVEAVARAGRRVA